MARSIDLPQHLDYEAAAELRTLLLDARGDAVVLDAEAVGFLGTLAIQVLLAARLQWQVDGHGFVIEKHSPAFAEACITAGLALSDFNQEKLP